MPKLQVDLTNEQNEKLKSIKDVRNSEVIHNVTNQELVINWIEHDFKHLVKKAKK